MKTTVEIDDRLWRLFSMIVLREKGGRKKSKVIEELIRRYIESRRSLLDPELMDYLNELEREKESFMRMLPHLEKEHKGKYVAVKDGKIAAVGDSKEEAAVKAYSKLGYSVIYVGYVGKGKVIRLPSPRLVR